MEKNVWIALGGNIGDREGYLKKALELMEKRGIKPVLISSFIETKAYGKTDQADFINAVCKAKTNLSPLELLHTLLDIEKTLKRVRIIKWGPRTIDLDILFYEDEVLKTEELTVPHPEMEKRSFVLKPLSEISPEKLHPVCKKTVKTLLDNLELSEETAWLNARMQLGIKPGLENIRALLSRLGNPHKEYPCLHIAGTNGKGSLCAYLSCVLENAGYKTGLFTSPAIETLTEQFRINRKNIPDSELLSVLKHIHSIVDDMEKHNMFPTYFEIITAIGFEYFKRRNADIAVIETGMGGLYDSTNVIEKPLASFITTIDYDHTDYLGDTLEKIAEHKAGIIKKDSYVFCYPNGSNITDIFKKAAKNAGSQIYVLNESEINSGSVSLTETVFSYGKFKDIHLSMCGKHQVNNAALAILGLTVLRAEQKLYFTDEQLYCGLNEAFLTARIEVLQKKPLFILDGSHNTEGIKALTETLSHLNYKRLILGIGILKDKNYGDMLKMLIPEASEIVVTEVPVARALKAEELFKEASLLHSNVYCEKNIFAALKKTFSAAEEEDLILWCGSLYLAGEIKKAYYFLRQEHEK